MKRTQLSLVVLGILALAGGGTALAAKSRGGSPPLRTGVVGHMFHGPAQVLDTASSYLGIETSALLAQLKSGKTLAQIANSTSGKSAQGLIDALVAAEKKSLADAVAAKRLTQAQADTISQMLTQRTTDFVNGTFMQHRPGFGPGSGFGHPGPFGELQAAADYLGTTVPALMTQLQSGKTLAQIASSTQGKSTSGLVDALVAQAKTKIAAAVTAGKLSQSQADTITSKLTQGITDLVNGSVRMHPGFRMGVPPAYQQRFFGHGRRT